MTEVPQRTDQVQPSLPLDDIDRDDGARADVLANVVTEATAEKPEVSLTPEEIVAIVEDSVYDTRSHISGRERDSGSIPVDSMRTCPIDIKLAAKFLDQGILERLAVVHSSNISFGRVKPDSQRNEEPIVGLMYTTLNRGEPYAKDRSKNYYYRNSMGGSGNFFQFNLFVPKSTADRVLSAIEYDPATIRQIGDVLMSREYSEEEWDKVKPPFEAWRGENGGVERLAIVSDTEAGPEDAQILEFK